MNNEIGLKGPEPEIYPRSRHSLSRTKIDPDALKIMYRLARHGYKAYLVGGGVRDVLLGKKPKDFDIATDATPRQVKALFRNSRIIGRRFKLVHVFYPDGKNIEVSTFRDISEEPENDDAEQSLIIRDNNYGNETTDAIRRDLTINALFYDISTHSIIDYVGGIRDLENRVIRVIGDPAVRFTEDPVRILRVVRHSARTGFSIETDCKKAVRSQKELLQKASQVRVFEEIKKDLVSGYCLPCLRLLHEMGLLSMLIPWLEAAGDTALREGAHLPICLERLDEKIKSGEEISPTVVLTLIALYCTPPGVHAHGFQHFDSPEAFEEHVKGVYSDLLVPRKERERMTVLATAFEHIVSFDGKHVRPLAVRGMPIEDLARIYECVLGESPDEELVKFLLKTGGKKQAQHGGDQHHHKRRRRSRARRRHAQ